MRSSVSLALAAATLCVLSTGCQPDTVRIAFRPAEGAAYGFEVTTDARTTTTLPGEPPDVTRDTAVLREEQRILEIGGDRVRVEVVVRIPDVGTQTYVVQLDRAAQLTEVETVEGIPTATLGELGLTEIFPAAAGAPPDRRLRTGDHWTIDDRVLVAGLPEPTRLSGTGELVELGVIDGHDTATVRSHYALPLSQTTTTPTGQGTLEGSQFTDVTVTYDLADGAVRRARATTTGRFTLRLSPPPNAPARPIVGTLQIEVHSETTRVDLPDG